MFMHILTAYTFKYTGEIELKKFRISKKYKICKFFCRYNKKLVRIILLEKFRRNIREYYFKIKN